MPEAETEVKENKSIVPSGWKSKNDDLKQFIDDQCSGKDGFEFPAFFTLCRQNGLPEEKVAHYEEVVDSKAHGAQGRAKMTLRNMLASVARKQGYLVGLDGETKTEIDLPKPAVSGAAAKAKEDKDVENGEDAMNESVVPDEDDGDQTE